MLIEDSEQSLYVPWTHLRLQIRISSSLLLHVSGQSVPHSRYTFPAGHTTYRHGNTQLLPDRQHTHINNSRCLGLISVIIEGNGNKNHYGAMHNGIIVVCPLFSRNREQPRTIANEANSSTVIRD